MRLVIGRRRRVRRPLVRVRPTPFAGVGVVGVLVAGAVLAYYLRKRP